MNLAVHYWDHDPFSLRLYRDNILRNLPPKISVLPFYDEALPDSTADLIWEPGLAGARVPPDYLAHTPLPKVATVHGAAPFILPAKENYSSFFSMIRGKKEELRCLHQWRKVKNKINRFIAVSNYGAHEISTAFRIDSALISPIYHGVDNAVFNHDVEPAEYDRPYFLMVAQYQPKKNVDRMFSAYKALKGDNKPDLVAIIPGFTNVGGDGITILRDRVTPVGLARWYRGSMAFIFPSLHETFGLPIIEAMACGSPVITSYGTACQEVAGGAALLVNPRNIDSIKDAMYDVLWDVDKRRMMSEASLVRAQSFTWADSAQRHVKVFEECIKGK